MRVVVAEDTMLTREGIVRLLGEAGVDVVAQAEDAGTLIRHTRDHFRSLRLDGDVNRSLR